MIRMRVWLTALIALALASPASAQQLNLTTTRQLVSSARITRTFFQYSYRVTVSNDAQPGLGAANLSAMVTSSSPNVIVIVSALHFPDLPPGQSVTSGDLLSIQVDRTVPFDPSVLQFSYFYDTGQAVPDVTGMTLSDAQAALAPFQSPAYAGFTSLGWPTNSPTVPYGLVATQYPLAGAVVTPAMLAGYLVPYVGLSLGPESAAGFSISLPSDYTVFGEPDPEGISLGQGNDIGIPIQIARDSGFTDPISIQLLSRINGVTAEPVSASADAQSAELDIFAAPTADVQSDAQFLFFGTPGPGFGSAEIVISSSTGTVHRLLRLTTTAHQPSSQEKIAAALAAGTIDLGTSYAYRMYAAMGDVRLPSELLTPGSVTEDESLPAEIANAEAQGLILPAAEALLHPYLVRPTDPDSFWSQPFSAAAALPLGSMVPAALVPPIPPAVSKIEANTCPPSPYPDPTWIYEHLNPGAVPDVIVWARCIPGQEETTFAALNRLWAVLGSLVPAETQLMGPLLPDNGEGLDKSVDFYMVPKSQTTLRGESLLTSSNEALGQTFPLDVGVRPKASSFVVIDDDQALLDNNLKYIHMTAAHELFHVLQMTHNYYGMFGSPSLSGRPNHWFVEASATWAEAYFDKSLQNLGGWARFSNLVHDGWFSNGFQLSRLPLNSQDDLHPYMSYIWPFFMQLQLGSDPGAQAVAATWTALEGVPEGAWNDAAPTTIDDVLDQVFPFKDNFSTFALTNLNDQFGTGPLTTFERYVSLDAGQFPDGVKPNPVPLIQSSSFNSTQTLQVLPLTVLPLSATYYRVALQGNGPAELLVDWSNVAPRTDDLDVQALTSVRPGPFEVTSMKKETEHSFCIGSGTGDGMDGYLVFSNSAKEPASIPTGSVSFKIIPGFLSTACGCSGNSGLYCPTQLVGNGPHVYDMNDLGQTVGFTQSATNFGLPTLWNNPSSLTVLSPASETRTGSAYRINNAGDVVGYYLANSAAGSPGNFALWAAPASPSGTTLLDYPTLLPGLGPNLPIAVDSDGNVALAGAGHRIRLWNGSYTDLAAGDEAWDINDFQHVLYNSYLPPATQPVSYLKQLRQLTTLPIHARRINNLDVVVGYLGSGAPGDPFVPARWTAKGGTEVLPVPAAPAIEGYTWVWSSAIVNAINDAGDMVGVVAYNYDVAAGGTVAVSHGVLWKADKTVADLRSVVKHNVCMGDAVAINSHGWIMGNASINLSAVDVGEFCGQSQPVLLVPPKPN